MKRQRKKYRRPAHPWEKERIGAENKLLAGYGLSQKREIWRTESLLRNIRHQARRLLAEAGPQAELEKKQLLTKLRKLGLVGEEATLDDVLGLNINNLLSRRLQTIVCKKGLAKTMKQARQLVLHGHIEIAGKGINVPSYLVPASEESTITYAKGTSFQPVKSDETLSPKPTAEEKVELSNKVPSSTEPVAEGKVESLPEKPEEQVKEKQEETA